MSKQETYTSFTRDTIVEKECGKRIQHCCTIAEKWNTFKGRKIQHGTPVTKRAEDTHAHIVPAQPPTHNTSPSPTRFSSRVGVMRQACRKSLNASPCAMYIGTLPLRLRAFPHHKTQTLQLTLPHLPPSSQIPNTSGDAHLHTKPSWKAFCDFPASRRGNCQSKH